MKICPACASQYPDDANFCPMDATRLKPLAPESTPALADAQQLIAHRFALGARSGSSPTGESFQATDSTTGERVHLKIIDGRTLPTAMQADRALREFKQLGKIRSPRIARIIEQGKLDDGRVFVVSEPLDGPTLAELVEREGPMPFERAREIVLAIGDALTEAQKVGVIHRDVSPRSVLLVGGEVKVTEFGIAEPVTERVFGTPAFLSPEQVEGKAVDQRSNIYSLGALLYYLLTGVSPFQGDVESILQQHLHTQPRPPSQVRPGLSPDVDKLVLKALEKSGGRRHLTLRQLLTELASLGPGGVGMADERARARYTPAAEMPAAMSSPTTPSMPVTTAADALYRPAPRGTQMGIPIQREAITMTPAPSAAPAAAQAAPVQPAPRTPPGGTARIDLTPRTPPGGTARSDQTPMPRTSPSGTARIDQTPARVLADAAPAAAAVQPARSEQTVPMAPQLREPSRPEPAAPPATVLRSDSTPASAVRADVAATRPTLVDEPAQALQPPAPQEASTRMASGAMRAQRPTPAQLQQMAGGPRGFRETAWFKQGELQEEEARAASSGDPFAGPSEMPQEIDESKLTADDHRRLSLKTGRTETMPVLKDLNMLGDPMSDAELLAEVGSSRKWLMISGVGIALLAILAGVYFLFLRSPEPPAATSAPPAAASHR